MRELVIASNNKHKIEEMNAILGSSFLLKKLSDIGCTDELPETQDTLEGNSLQKARYVFERYGIPCFADDSGLEVDALLGAPGVYSAMYAGDHRSADDNIALLLKNLEGTSNRAARFRAVITLIDKRGTHIFEGEVKGTILHEKRGIGGFGYDPVFQPDGFPQSFAEIDPEVKNKISHRARAMKKLADYLIQS